MEIVGETSRYALQEHLHLIAAPLQVIWGKKDQVTYDVPLKVTQQSLYKYSDYQAAFASFMILF